MTARFPGIALVAAVLLLAAPARAADETVPLDRYFRGTVVGLKGKVVSLRYDFSDAEQGKDWSQEIPFPVQAEKDQGIRWFDGMLEVKGSTGARHKAVWTGEVSVSCTLVPDTDKDVGAFFAPHDGASDYAAFALQETYFHKWDGSAGGNHTILKFGKQWRESGSTADFVGFRYVQRRPPNRPMKAGDRIPVTFSGGGGALTFVLPDFELQGKELGKRLKLFHLGFYSIQGRLLVDDVVITGRLADAWLAQEKVSLTTEKPIAPPVSGDVDPAVRGLIEGYAAGTTPPEDLVKVLGDPSRPAATRAAVAAALGKGPKKAVTQVLDLLYSADEATRAHGIGVVRALLGKDYGFNPKGSEDSRSAAVRKLNDDLRAHPDLLNG